MPRSSNEGSWDRYGKASTGSDLAPSSIDGAKGLGWTHHRNFSSTVPQTTPDPGPRRSRPGESAIGRSSDFALERSRLSELKELGRAAARRYSPAITVEINMAERNRRVRGAGGASLGQILLLVPELQVWVTARPTTWGEVRSLSLHISTDRTQAPRERFTSRAQTVLQAWCSELGAIPLVDRAMISRPCRVILGLT